jgi:hypothetical protein
MTDVATPAGTGTPAAAAPIVTTPVAAPPAVTPVAPDAASVVATPAAATEPPALDPQWLNQRLERSKQAGASDLLKTLGVSKIEDAKAAIDAAKAAEESKKTAEQRAAEAFGKASAAEQAASRAQALIREQAGRMMMALEPAHQKIIADFAGDDPEQQLRAIQHFAPTWAKAAEPIAAAPPVTAPPVTTAPVNTAPPPGAPPGNAPGSPPDHRGVYTQLKNANPFKAAAYGLQNFSAVHVPKT